MWERRNNEILPRGKKRREVGRGGGREEGEEGGRKERREGGRRGGRRSKECLIYPPQVTSASSESNLHFDKSPTLLERK